MQRVVVVGRGGSGKSVIARQLGAALDLPVTHLDAVFYDQQWNQLSNDEFAARQRTIAAGERWIIDGNYASTLPIRLAAADAVIFLDLPALTCVWGIVQRRVRHDGGQHPDVGVYDRVNASFIRYVIGYRRTMRPRVRSLVAEHAPTAQFFAPTSRRGARHMVEQICGHAHVRGLSH